MIQQTHLRQRGYLNQVLEVLEHGGSHVELPQLSELVKEALSVSRKHVRRQRCMKTEQDLDAEVVQLGGVLYHRDERGEAALTRRGH